MSGGTPAVRRVVSHTPVWEPADLPVDAAGNTKPGYVCVHPLENGNGPCGGNVFSLDQAIGDHSCVVAERSVTIPKPTPEVLWRQAGGGTPDYSRERYLDLMREHGHLVPLAPGETAEPLPCGWPGPQRPDFDPEEEDHG